MSKKPQVLAKPKPPLPSKADRQAKFRVDVAQRELSAEDAVDEARLIPKAMAHEFKVRRWPR